MSGTTSLWWPEDRIQATLCPEYIVSHLSSNSLPQLVKSLPWGAGLTSETYLDWILIKAGRLFLILVDIGIPERIFALVDESLEDADLPFAAHTVGRLGLSPDGENQSLNTKFFHAQWRFIVRGIGEGEQVKYTENEGVPVELQRARTATTLAKDGVEKVVLAGAVCRVYLRTRVPIGAAPHFFKEEDVLGEIRSLRNLAHDHIFSIYGSYIVDDTICILFSGVYERTLMSVLTDTPQPLKRLPKPQRREILINWPHCLANGLSWLHAHGQTHGAIRPSNILVDSDYKIFLGQFEVFDSFLPPFKPDDVEAYQYGAPERWVLSATVQEKGPQQTIIPSGGRTAGRRVSRSGGLNMSKLKEFQQQLEPSSPVRNLSRSDSVTSQGTAIRVGFSGSSDGSSSTREHLMSSAKRPIFYTPSIASSSSSGSSSSRRVSTISQLGELPGTNLNQNTVVHTWQSHQTNPDASDMFSLGAVILDILTHLCKRKISAFSNHRGAKNRIAGRGGGTTDCSFHLDRNAGQVSSWIALLDHDAKKGKDPAFRAVQPILAVVRNMLDKDPGSRPSAIHVERQFSRALRPLEGTVQTHCLSKIHSHAQSEGTLRESPSHMASGDSASVTNSTSPSTGAVTTGQHFPFDFEPDRDLGTLHENDSNPTSSPPESINTNFDFDWGTDPYAEYYSSGSDLDPGLRYSNNHGRHDSDLALSPMMSNDSALGYGVAIGGS